MRSRGRPGSRLRIRPLGTALLVLLALMVVPAAAEAGCGGVQAAASKRNLAKGPEPLAIGDSVMLLAVKRARARRLQRERAGLPPVEPGPRDPAPQEAPGPPAPPRRDGARHQLAHHARRDRPHPADARQEARARDRDAARARRLHGRREADPRRRARPPAQDQAARLGQVQPRARELVRGRRDSPDRTRACRSTCAAFGAPCGSVERRLRPGACRAARRARTPTARTCRSRARRAAAARRTARPRDPRRPRR